MIDRGLRFTAIAMVAMVAVWAGARIHSARAHHSSAGIAIPVGEASAPTRSDLVDQSQPPPISKIPDRLPVFALAALDGKLTPITTWSGKSLVINFWATWCAPCRREIPLLEGLSAEWASRGITVIGIAVDHRDQVASFARELKIRYPLLVGEQEALDVASRFAVDSPAFPFTVFTDRRGEVVALYMGELHKPQTDLILSTVQDLDQNRVALREARQIIVDGLHALAGANPGGNVHNS
jgi:thiol-disulfide isomerase/thioredoxin